MDRPHLYLISYDALLKLVDSSVTSTFESTPDRSTYNFVCGCVAMRAADSAFCSVLACFEHATGFAAPSQPPAIP